MATPQFKSAQVHDLLHHGFHGEKSVVEVKSTSKTVDSVAFLTRASWKAGQYTGLFNPKFSYSPFGFHAHGQIDTKGHYEAHVHVKDQGVKGLSGFLTCRSDTAFKEDKPQAPLVVGAGFQNESANVHVHAHLGKSTVAVVEIAAESTGVTGGVKAKYDVDGGSLDLAHATLGYTTKELSAALFGKKKGDKTTAGVVYYHNPVEGVQLGAKVVVDANSPTDVPKFDVGGKYALDSVTNFKAKINQDAVVNFGFEHTVNANTKLSFGGKVDSVNFTSADKHSFGFGVSFTY